MFASAAEIIDESLQAAVAVEEPLLGTLDLVLIVTILAITAWYYLKKKEDEVPKRDYSIK